MVSVKKILKGFICIIVLENKKDKFRNWFIVFIVYKWISLEKKDVILFLCNLKIYFCW